MDAELVSCDLTVLRSTEFWSDRTWRVCRGVWCVIRPSSSCVSRLTSEHPLLLPVAVLLQPMKVDPPPGAKCKDKFLVQSSLIEASMEHLNLAEIVRSLSSALAIVGLSLTLLWVLLRQWSSIEKEGKERISEQKIRCAYIDAEDEDAVPHSPDETTDGSTLIDGSVSPTHRTLALEQLRS